MSCKSVSTALGAIALAASIWATAAHVAPAKAADIPDYDDSLKDTVVYAPAPIWTGIYVGAHVGYMWAEWDGAFNLEGDTPDGFDGSDKSIDGDDWMAGLQIGANYQSGRWVVGAEADVSWTGAEGSLTFVPFPDPQVSQFHWDIDAEIELFGTARARLGHLVRDDLLLYATGGLAWAEVESDIVVTDNFGADFVASGDHDETHFGYAIGGGLEWKMADNWSLKTEYLYFDLGEEEYAYVRDEGLGADDGYDGDRYEPELDGHIVRIGVNYLFGGRDEPVDSYK